MTLIGHMVVRNEMGRYLQRSLGWLAELTNGRVLVYDDQSTDGTADYIRNELLLPVAVRPDHVPAFAQDESAFRRSAWDALEHAYGLTTDDWILAIDADEFLVDRSQRGDRASVRGAVDRAVSAGETAVTFSVAEVFGHDAHGDARIRTDGYWGHIQACRLVRWRPGGRFHPRIEGGGSVPSNWPKSPLTNGELAILHYGYATPADRATKHHRYSNGRGHNPAHVASILQPPTTRRWLGMPAPEVKP